MDGFSRKVTSVLLYYLANKYKLDGTGIGPGWMLSQGVLQSDETNISAQMYVTKVLCPPWYWNRGPGWLSSQGVLQSD